LLLDLVCQVVDLEAVQSGKILNNLRFDIKYCQMTLTELAINVVDTLSYGSWLFMLGYETQGTAETLKHLQNTHFNQFQSSHKYKCF
jgi:hypothetical protein